MDKMRTHLDLFSGIGGFALAARWAGVQTIGFAEIDAYASKVLAKNFPGVPNYGDIRTVPAIDNVWLVTGGFPCQPFSVAGKRGGKGDDRWLWPALAVIIERVRPTWVLAENVPGIIGMELDTVLSDLETIGYTTCAVVVPACAVDAQHRRDRVWIVAHTDEGNSRWWAIQPEREAQGRIAVDGRGAHVADAAGINEQRPITTGDRRGQSAMAPGNGDGFVPHPNSAGLAQREGESGDPRPQCAPTERGCDTTGEPSIWQPESELGRVVNGVSNRVDRLRGLGNAIVPQVAYQFIIMMIDAEELP